MRMQKGLDAQGPVLLSARDCPTRVLAFTLAGAPPLIRTVLCELPFFLKFASFPFPTSVRAIGPRSL
jgi:hypothetical protein